MIAYLNYLIVTLLFFIGASIFSFLNVVIYRVPRKQNFVTGRSMCPVCGKTLLGLDMVPVLNWFFLKGKCRFCKGKISVRYPLVEAFGGFCMLLSVMVLGFNIKAVLVFAFLCMLVVVSLVDLDTMEIPNGFVIWAAILGVISIFVFPEIDFMSRIIGIFSVSVPLLVLSLLISGAFGGGDIKLMAACGIFLGWKLNLLSLFFGILTGGIYGIYLLTTRKKGRKEHFAFGPFLCIGMMVSVFWGDNLLNWYLGLFGL